MIAMKYARARWAPAVLAVAVACALAACKKDEAPAASPQAAQPAAPAPTPESVVAASVSAMTAEQLRDAANKAYNDNRLYAPAGNNAMEYFLALRDKVPGDAGAASALTDLLPMTVIATEQGIAREDLDEARRLLALIGKADPHHPALARLKASVASSEARLKQQAQTQQLTQEEEARRREELAKKREEDQKKLQEQQRQQQVLLAQQQQAAAEAEAERQRQAAAEQQREQPAATPPAAPVAAAAPRPRPAAMIELRPVSQPGPKFPAAAQRAGASATVQVEFTVGTDGAIASARVVSSDAPRQFQRDFEREALLAVKRWRFQPVSQATTSRRTIVFQP